MAAATRRSDRGHSESGGREQRRKTAGVGKRVDTAAPKGVGCRQAVHRTAPYRMGNGATDGGKRGGVTGDACSPMGDGTAHGAPRSPQQHLDMSSAQGKGKVDCSSGVDGGSTDEAAATGGEQEPMVAVLDPYKGGSGCNVAFSESNTVSCVHGSRSTLPRVPEEQAMAARRFFDAKSIGDARRTFRVEVVTNALCTEKNGPKQRQRQHQQATSRQAANSI